MKNTVKVFILALLMLTFAGCGIGLPAEGDYIQAGGHKYKLNENLRTSMPLGIDTEGSLREEKEPGMGGQSDAIYLLVCNMEDRTSRVIGIPRDTMTEIRIFLPSGEDNGTSIDHLTLQYGFGDGMEKSCLLTEEAVSKLMCGLPIDGYLAVNLGAVPDLAEALGGIQVVVPDDSAKKEEKTFEKGAVVTLDRTNVKKFLRFRDTDVSQSAVIRMERHKAFFKGCLKTLREIIKNDPTQILRLYNQCSSQFLTDISPDQCLELAGLNFDENVEIIPGEYTSGKYFDEFYADESGLEQMVVDVFCR